MNVKRIFSVLLLLCVVVGATSAYCPVMVGGAEACCLTGDGDQIHLNVKKLINHPNNDFKEPRTPILVPELTMDGHTLHFVTPCTPSGWYMTMRYAARQSLPPTMWRYPLP